MWRKACLVSVVHGHADPPLVLEGEDRHAKLLAAHRREHQLQLTGLFRHVVCRLVLHTYNYSNHCIHCKQTITNQMLKKYRLNKKRTKSLYRQANLKLQSVENVLKSIAHDKQ